MTQTFAQNSTASRTRTIQYRFLVPKWVIVLPHTVPFVPSTLFLF